MHYLFVIALTLLGASCSNPEIVEPELAAINAQYDSEEEFDFLNGLDLYKRSTEVQIFELDQRIAELSEAIETGEEGYAEELENAQRDRERLYEHQELLETLIRPIGGRGPGPRPPKGCFVANCTDGINIRGVHGISIPQETMVESLEIKNQAGEIIGEGTELAENEYGDLMMQFETNEFEGIAIMYISTRVEGNSDQLMIKIPVAFN